MRDDEKRFRGFCGKIFKNADKTVETPQVDARFGFVENGEFALSCERNRYFDSFQFAARKARVYLSVHVFPRAKPHFGKIIADFAYGKAFAARNLDEVGHGYAFEFDGLLKSERDACFRAVGDRKIGYVFSVEYNPSARGLYDARYDFCKG